MMFVSIFSLFVSFLLQGLFSNFFNYTIGNLSIFTTVFVLINFVVLQEYFEDNKKFVILIVIFGLFMDIVYNSTAFLSVFIFVVVFLVNKVLKFFLPYNFFTVNLFSIISVLLYHFISFFFLIVLRFDSYSIIVLLKIVYSSFIMTFIYTSFLYFIINYVFKKFDLKNIRER